MRRVGEESTRGVGIPGESVPCSPRLHGFSARACVSLFAKPLRVGEEDFAFPFLFSLFLSNSLEYNELDDV